MGRRRKRRTLLRKKKMSGRKQVKSQSSPGNRRMKFRVLFCRMLQRKRSRTFTGSLRRMKRSLEGRAEERMEKQGDDVKEADCQPETPPHGRIGRLLAKIRALAGKIQALPGKLQFSFYSICDKLKNGKNLVTEKKAWLEDEKNQASIRLVLKQAKRLLIHVMPGKGKGSLTFGFEDPYTTGQVLEAFSLIYPFCHRHLTIHPVFDEKILEAEGALRGRVRAGYILWLAIGILKDKHTRRLIRGFLK